MYIYTNKNSSIKRIYSLRKGESKWDVRCAIFLYILSDTFQIDAQGNRDTHFPYSFSSFSMSSLYLLPHFLFYFCLYVSTEKFRDIPQEYSPTLSEEEK